MSLKHVRADRRGSHTGAPHERGFTLIEIMISVSLFAVIAISITASMSNSFEVKRELTEINDRYHEGRQVMRRITREIRMAFLRAQPPEEVQEEGPAVITRFLGEEDEIYFASNAHIRLRAEGRESDQSEVAYFLKSPSYETPYRGKTLFRRESRRVDDRPDRGGSVWPVIDGVKTLKIEYWDDSKEIGDDAWQRDWDSDDNQLLPARVRVTLELERRGSDQKVRFVAQAAPKIRRPIQSITEYKR